MRTVRLAIIVSLVGLLEACGPSGAPGKASQSDPGARVYGMNCLSCHQKDGHGLTPAQPSLAGSPTANGDPEVLIRWVLFGERPATLVRHDTPLVMPQFTWLKDEDIAAVLTYIRSNFGNSSPAVTPDVVARVRAAHAAK
jgi:mono/diheme cytochrome c family protein